MFRPYINAEERESADKQLPRLMTEGLLLGGSGLGVLALIFEIAADAFSVAAYQTLLAIEGAGGDHRVATIAFTLLSIMLFFGVVPSYKAAAYLRPNAGGSGPLVEAIGPEQIRWASWIGTSLFFLDAVLTIIISSISAADVTMLILPEWSDFRIFLAEGYAFFIMAVLVALGPKKAVPLFLIGGGAFTIFTIFALAYVGFKAGTDPSLGEGTDLILERLNSTGIIDRSEIHTEIHAIGQLVFFQALLRSMSSAMLGFSGYEVIPASGKHAAKPKWKVINTALTLAAIFLIGTGIIQLLAASVWDIPATVGYSTLLIEYELVFGQSAMLTIAGVLLSIILLLAQGGGYIGGAAVASNAARLGRLPKMFLDDRNGILVIWGVSFIMIPIIRTVTVVEAYYAFGFVSAFVITSTTVYFVRDDILRSQNIEPDSPEAKSLRFAGLRGMIASYAMLVILITQKSDALAAIIIFGGLLTAFQIYISRGNVADKNADFDPKTLPLKGLPKPTAYDTGLKRAHDEARQRGIVEAVNNLIAENKLIKFNVSPEHIHRLISHEYRVDKSLWVTHEDGNGGHHEVLPEPSLELEATFNQAACRGDEIVERIEHYSHYGIFTFINKYSHNWEGPNRDQETVERSMVKALFVNSPFDEVWDEFKNYDWDRIPEPIWQFCRERYRWAKSQWPNLSDQITTIWTLQDLTHWVDTDEQFNQMIDLLRNKSADDLAKTIRVHPQPDDEEGIILTREEALADDVEDTHDDQDNLPTSEPEQE